MCLFTCSYGYDDPRIKKQIKDYKEQYEILGTGLLADYIPIARYIPLPQVTKMKNMMKTYFEEIEEEFVEHRKSFDPGMAQYNHE